MLSKPFQLYAGGLLLMLLAIQKINAQKLILIDEELAANSQPLTVKVGAAFMGKMPKYNFPGFELTSGKAGWTTTTTRSNLFNTKTERKTTNKFSFTLKGDTAESLTNAATNMQTKELHSLQIVNSLYWGSDEIVESNINFSGTIRLQSDTANPWLFMLGIENGRYKNVLTNGSRTINIIVASSQKPGDPFRTNIASGYQFFENEKPIAAMQYIGGSSVKNLIWLHKELDETTRLAIASNAVALFHWHLTNLPE